MQLPNIPQFLIPCSGIRGRPRAAGGKGRPWNA